MLWSGYTKPQHVVVWCARDLTFLTNSEARKAIPGTKIGGKASPERGMHGREGQRMQIGRQRRLIGSAALLRHIDAGFPPPPS